MTHRPALLCALALLGALSANAFAQAVPTATRSGTAQVGAGVSLGSPDFGTRYIKGISLFGDLDFGAHLGAEADAHLVSYITPTDIGQDTFLVGPRYTYRRKRLNFYGKALFGLGEFQYQYDNIPHFHESYFVYAFGGGLDINLSRHYVLRAVDFESQRWPGYRQNGLTPYVTTFGVAYAFR